MRLPIALGLSLVLMAGCGNDLSETVGPLEPWTAAAGIPTHAEITCSTDGSVSLSTGEVQPRPDGVHLRVVNEFDEMVSVEGFDADPGVTNWTFATGPGTMELMCWPFSQHSSGDEPSRFPLEIVDPTGLYVDGSVDCEFDGDTTVDYMEEPVDRGPPPMDVARDLITGLQPDDILRASGYPEQEGASVLVIREGDVIASYWIARFRGEPWRISGRRVCAGTGLRYEGQSFG